MRNAAAAIVPLFLAIMLLFWFIMFMGGSSDTLRAVSNVENLSHLQTKLLLPAEKFRNELKRANPSLSDDELDRRANIYVNNMMVLNKIQK